MGQPGEVTFDCLLINNIIIILYILENSKKYLLALDPMFRYHKKRKQATVPLKVVSSKRRCKFTLNNIDRFTNK